jgi:chromosome partitioning protein
MVQSQTRRRTHVVAVGNQKGGVGKTTNTVHLATALGELGRKCLIMDLDMNHGATRHFGVTPEGFMGSFEVLIGAEENPLTVIVTEEDREDGVVLPPNVHLICGRRSLEAVDQVLAEKNKFLAKQDILLEPLKKLRGEYDYIFLDTAPNATTPTIAAYKAADLFILSALPDPFAIAGLSDALTDIRAAQEHGNPDLKLLGVILSAVDKRTRLANQLTNYIESLFAPGGGVSLKFRTEISRSTVIPEAQKAGRTVFDTNPAHKVAEQYRALAREVEVRVAMLDATPELGSVTPGEPATNETQMAVGEQ